MSPNHWATLRTSFWYSIVEDVGFGCLVFFPSVKSKDGVTYLFLLMDDVIRGVSGILIQSDTETYMMNLQLLNVITTVMH